MAVKIFHKDHGFVITADQDIIDMLLAKGGIITSKANAMPNNPAQKEIVKPQPIKRKGK